MNRKELELHKELAVMHMRVARAELALEQATPSNKLAAVRPALDLASLLLEQFRLGRWGKYLRVALRVAKVVLNVAQPRAE